MNEIAMFFLWWIFFIFVGFSLNWIIRKSWSWGKNLSPIFDNAFNVYDDDSDDDYDYLDE